MAISCPGCNAHEKVVLFRVGQEGGPPPWVAFGRKTKEVDTSKSAFEIGGKGASEEGDDKEGSQEKNEEFEKQRDEALQVLEFEPPDHPTPPD